MKHKIKHDFILCFLGIVKSSPGPGKDKVAEYISPPRSKVPTPLEIEVEEDQTRGMETKSKVKQETSKLTEPVKVAELASMSSKELDEHLSGLRNNVKRLQEMECSFVRTEDHEDRSEG